MVLFHIWLRRLTAAHSAFAASIVEYGCPASVAIAALRPMPNRRTHTAVSGNS